MRLLPETWDCSRNAGKASACPLGSETLNYFLLQAALGKFISGIYSPGGEIDAGSLRSGVVVIRDNPAGAAGHCCRDQRCGISIGDLRDTTAGSARRRTVLNQPEEEEVSATDTDMG